MTNTIHSTYVSKGRQNECELHLLQAFWLQYFSTDSFNSILSTRFCRKELTILNCGGVLPRTAASAGCCWKLCSTTGTHQFKHTIVPETSGVMNVFTCLYLRTSLESYRVDVGLDQAWCSFTNYSWSWTLGDWCSCQHTQRGVYTVHRTSKHLHEHLQTDM